MERKINMKKKCKDCGEEFEEWHPQPGVTFIPPPKEYRDKCEKCRRKIYRLK